MLKLSNETKVGVLTVLGITLLVLGFNLLKGKSLFSHNKTIYAVYHQVNGLQPANAVQVNGLVVGNVANLEVMGKDASRILVAITITKKIDIPRNSVARISSDLLGTKTVQLDLGNAGEYLQSGDTIYAAVDGSMTDALKEQLNPLVKKLEGTLSNIDSVLMSVNAILDTTAKGNLQDAIRNLNTTMRNFTHTSASLNGMLDPNNGNIQKTFDNLAAVTGNLKDNNGKITGILDNAQKATDALAKGNIDKTLLQLQQTVTGLNQTLNKLNTTDGTAGMLLNDKKAYNNLQYSLGNLNKLLEDLRVNPKRYVHFSLFGKKDKTKPLPSDTIAVQ
ncbi:phospholipid/cholesterol/gamma-HCH transport system substrate-binding protein [Chitinophaga ginsengisegetis]|uniref:Phospholipid/cholesterol/gamma-HCH transport system substrate-binding protein n=1 Tax=Chitinophaga ginsengisegetis TaxID=393003 RepID=A0A1T5PBV1_9BACT|nr:MlaD family protein [Chitinophaga ginsengisegetis]MDR6569289.1 phospholipid/cholesterol/gamma-HCH transport system substrate-binding protein [Chitinophaga ginsengisegetis]MDR6648680.1 phospholipid/cholesterol/gamma-HCH transport system substrate-binding protein [Chitinophaga ginsengisegetis]MDR6655372.1 phospholipid/cholesterol/gamma-HCH transport system substrate-binding protein [Chitinophaga ginsengisegetis]SKD10230.1 phospholipid/cholesterol/gamma-HCH transport system substrate-binding pr